VLGHTHAVVPSLELGGALVTQAGRNGEALGRVDLELERDGAQGRWRIKSRRAQVIAVSDTMPADPDLLPILTRLTAPGATWQVTAIGRANIWPLHRRTAELGGNLRTGLEDTFYLPDGSKATSNGPLIDAIVRFAREAGREIASPAEARSILHLQ
jgi:uncharacterized protein (DUF849 family)